jgi:D-alanyl-lipoteichoic acid acyltransferase DltB (MBOAT superfamily)
MSFLPLSFTSLIFYGLLLVAASLYYCVPGKWRGWYLLGLSYAFYATWSPIYLLMLIGATALVYWLGLKIAATSNETHKKLFMAGGIVAIIGLVVFYKLAGVLHGVLLPLGLSYYSFKLISYLIDVYWDDKVVEHDALLFFIYPAFFPQIVSGPIQRAGDFFTQVRERIATRADYAKIEEGYRLILGGLMMKLLIGDRLGAFIDIVDKSPTEFRLRIILTTLVCYTLQLYADFSGYTNIAIGIGKLFGIDSPPNFNAPFAAPNIQEMWRRWHMSLTTWVTDYLFSPLQMALRNFGTAGLTLCITINMVVIGLWHGLTLNFLAFGLCHAVFVVVTVLTRKFRDRLFGKNKWLKAVRIVLGIILTFLLMTFSQIFWHTHTWADAITHFNLAFRLMPSGTLTWTDIRTDVVDPVFVCMGLAFFFGLGSPGTKWLRRLTDRFIPNWVEYGFYMLMISALTIESGSKFVYGQF